MLGSMLYKARRQAKHAIKIRLGHGDEGRKLAK
jgi:hypothetical protein